jgi:hypothetical protein
MSDTTTTRRTGIPVGLHISAWLVPVMVLGQFAMLAIVPLAVLVVGSFVSARARVLRWWTAALAAVYAIPLVIWIVRPDGAPSLSKDMHPVFYVLIAIASAAVLARMYIRRR